MEVETLANGNNTAANAAAPPTAAAAIAAAAAAAAPSSKLTQLAESLKLEHQFLRVPFENYKKTIRANHRVVEKEVSDVVSGVSDAADNGELSAVEHLNSLVSRLQGLKRKLEEGSRTEHLQAQRCRARLDHLESADVDNLSEWSDMRLKRILVDYMLRMSYYDTALKLAESSNILDLVDIDVFNEAKKVIDALQNKEVAPALAWCTDNKSRLKKSKNMLKSQLQIDRPDKLADSWALRKMFGNLFNNSDKLFAHQIEFTLTCKVDAQQNNKLTPETLEQVFDLVEIQQKGMEIKVGNLQPEQGGADVKNSKENGANVCILTSLESKFEFQLRLQEFIELVRAENNLRAITYARKYLAPWGTTHMKELQRVMATLAFKSSTDCATYKMLCDTVLWLNSRALVAFNWSGMAFIRCLVVLFEPKQWDYLVDQFRQEFCKIYGMTFEPLLNIYLQAGLSALKTPFCYEDDCTKEDPLSQESFRKLAQPLPFSKQHHSKLLCYITKELMDTENPPLVLPNGYVYSTKALEEMAKKNCGRITCPRTGLVCNYLEVEKAYIS
ncbi:hypothetical protein RHSIM_Rhsim09G0155700 [Rhododendron simsii]|uniref:Macrophage erythroblast attacher n=1 Tax=Rhododendron simsii TaxID=118357 RepID=A0A834LF35_RHOSS|nr:hypothetical protein RHSIM_Rhsim09G0155700 [Rhododendron simsii]